MAPLTALALVYDPWRGRFLLYGLALAASTWGLVLRHRWLAWGMTSIATVTIVLAFVHSTREAGGRPDLRRQNAPRESGANPERSCRLGCAATAPPSVDLDSSPARARLRARWGSRRARTTGSTRTSDARSAARWCSSAADAGHPVARLARLRPRARVAWILRERVALRRSRTPSAPSSSSTRPTTRRRVPSRV